MKAPKLTLALGLALALLSCQKEITDGTPEQPGGGTGGNQNGDRLVKLVQISPSFGDTNIITCKWDASGRLVEYKSAGVVNTIATNVDTKINRLPDGKIKTIYSKSSLTFNFIDSVISTVYYLPGTNKLAYSINMQYSSFLGEIKDSCIFTYNATGRIIAKETFQDIFGTMDPTARQTYEYDGNGNVTKITDFSYNGGSYDQDAVTINTFDGHKAPFPLGEESYISFNAINSSVNNLVKQVTNAVASGATYTTIVSDLAFNSFDRPTKFTMSATGTNGQSAINTVTLYYQ